ncbi:glycoside hydrolase family 3 N-terminal domain-containing protein [Sinisalibacter aestuarii]|uniref:beta-N-acetylhexosaminidase n=1 Tax=Sinisalibacter aestuarii TaxID=2949426 RepID=A0ABQ5LT24_9RHOB|nr:glycoside hydrolase family 3 N-terminal domain-containing protein [Sinisalibacter aestuarii]GKY87565.1 beta-N-acetylhexosaminidase [Sinisalibacter aestuarii]
MRGTGAYIFGLAGPRLTARERDFFAESDPFGFILFARNVEDPEQLLWLTTELREAVGWHAPVFIDQEGGRVARLGPPHWRSWLPPLEQVAQNRRHAARAMYLRYRIIAHELSAVGIDGNCAPVVDIAQPDTHPILRNRCFGEDVVHVADIAGSAAEGLVKGGVLPVIKHIPGHGRATADSHLDLPHVDARAKVLRVSDFLAFEAVSGLPIAMTAHVVYDAIDPDRPATLSPDVIALIRERIGFGGLLVTDDISMQALSGPVPDRASAALAAGCDVVLHCNGDLAEMEALATAAGRMGEEAARRAEAALGWRRTPDAIDIAALEDEFRSLMTGQV